MAQLTGAVIFLLIGLLQCATFDCTFGQESDETNFVKFDNLARFVLESFNGKPDSVYQYKSAQVITGLAQNDSESTSYYLNLNFAVACNTDFVSQAECFPKHLICKVVVTEDPSNGEWKLRDEATNCNLPEAEEEISEPENEPTNAPGSVDKQEEDMKAMFDDLGPFLLKHLNPLSETVGTTAIVDLEHPVDIENKPPVSEVVDIPAVKKQAHCTGCLTDINVDLPALQDFVEQALTRIDETSNTQYKHNLVRIAKAQKQVVSGVRYVLTLDVGETSCLKSSLRERDACELNAAEPKTCVVEFLDKLWLGTRDVVTSSCANDKNDLENEIVPQRFDSDVMDYLDGMARDDEQEVPTVRERREVGGLKDITSSEKLLVHELAELGVRTLDEIDADDSRRVVLEVLGAKKQLVNGVLYHLKLRVGTTSCDENGSTTPGCLKDQVASPKICNIQLHRSFAADSPNDIKVVKSECTNELHSRHRRSVPGCYSLVNVSDPYIQDIATYATAQLDQASNSPFRQSVVRIVKAEKQVVSGLNVRLTLELADSTCRKDGSETCQSTEDSTSKRVCTVEVWDRPWLKKRQLSSSSCEEVPARKKRHTLLGGAMEIDVKDPHIQPLAHLSLAHIEAQSNALYSQKIVRIVHATRQVVAGVKYTITMEVGYTSCRKPSNSDLCDVSQHSNNQLCTAEVWDRPWLNDTHVTKVSCTPVNSNRVKRAVLIGGGTHDIHVGMFRDFMTKHGKAYQSKEEEKRRFHIFRANMKKVETLQKTEQGTGKYGATRFADLTSKEFKKFHLGLNPALKSADGPALYPAEIPQISLPPEFDWRHYNVVTPVKNQGMCGSCWAFSVTGNVEGQWALRHQELLSLSEQELVDCDKLDDGCKGGLPENAYKAITSIGGLETESDYPYDGADETCHFNKTEVRVSVTGGLNITSNETQMAQWLVKNGPISIGINANAMQFYMGGVSHPWKFLCSPDNLDHGVLIVGYGVHTSSIRHKILPYWIVKNSWGPSWGEKGYYRVYRGDSTCGVNQMATSAIVG